MNMPHKLSENLPRLRSFLEDCWGAWQQERKPWVFEREDYHVAGGMCRFTAAFLLKALPEYLDDDWFVAGGISRKEFGVAASGRDIDLNHLDGGMLSTNGEMESHYWVVGPRSGIIVDLAADQFGWDPVIVTEMDDERYISNLKKAALREHFKHVDARASSWLSDWRDRPEDIALAP